MAEILWANNAASTLNGAITNIQTTITLNDASSFAAPTGGQISYATIDDGTNIEIITYTGVSTNDLTGVTRGVDGTSGTAFADAVTVEQRITKAMLNDILASDLTPELRGNLDCAGNNIRFDNNTGITDDSGNEHIRFIKTTSAVNQFDFTNAATGTGPKISASGGDANIDIQLAPSGSGAVTTSSNIEVAGLSFDSGTNVMSEYEIGTFTPAFDFDTTGDLSNSYSVQSGNYLRIGDLVFISFGLIVTPTFTTSAGDIRLTGLPFTCDAPYGLTILSFGNNFNWDTGYTQVNPTTESSTSYVKLRQFGDSVVRTNMDTTNVTSGLQLDVVFSGMYKV